ncbi:MAG: glycosyltransferase family 87 protein [Chloroflexota bacterium]
MRVEVEAERALGAVCLRDSPPGDPALRESRPRGYAVVVPLCILLVLWIWLFASEGAFRGGPSGNAFGADFAMFYSAGQVMHNGGNPYDHTLLYRSERSLMQRQHLAMTGKREVVRVGNPPLFLWALQPLIRLPFQIAAYAWVSLMYALSLAGFIAALTVLGWRRRMVPSLIFLLMPEVALGAFYGNPVAIVFAAMSLALASARRFPASAGVLLSLAWIKPPVALPLAMLVLLFQVSDRRRAFAGFASATLVFATLTPLLVGWASLGLWLRGLLAYSHDMAIQPDVASLAGLYVRWAPVWCRAGLEVAVLGAALAVTGLVLVRTRGSCRPSPTVIACLWIVWIVATPYAHYFDETLLTVPLLMFIGRDGERLTKWPVILSLYLSFFSLIFVEKLYFRANLLSLFLLATLACGITLARQPVQPGGRLHEDPIRGLERAVGVGVRYSLAAIRFPVRPMCAAATFAYAYRCVDVTTGAPYGGCLGPSG